MENTQHTVIPVLRIFDIAKAKEFYIDWPGFTVDREHRYGENFPLYMQVSKDNIKFHLTEHYGDCSPGAKVFIAFTGELANYQIWLTAKYYRYYKPGLEKAPWNAATMTVTDPFGNKLLFSEAIKK
jgi:uncharacterized glyoxalase superfamily protein PhnB